MTVPVDPVDPVATPPATTADATTATSNPSAPARRRLAGALRPRVSRRQLVVGALCAALGFGLVAQLETSDDEVLRTARSGELVQLLDDLQEREQRLVDERADLVETRDRLLSGADSEQAALREAEARAHTLGVLAGTVPLSGPGVVIRIADPENRVTAPVLLDAVQELRDAGAQALQIGPVRVVASTSFVDGPGAGEVRADGVLLSRPFEIRAVGDPATMATAMGIPGGVADTVAQVGGEAVVTEQAEVEVTALRPVPTPRYARPAPSDHD